MIVEKKHKKNKWSAYKSENEAFEWAREDHPHEFRTAEAHLMDWADDVAYSVHDLEDFHRCRAIPWYEIRNDLNRQNLIVDKAYSSWFGAPRDARAKLEKALGRLLNMLLTFDDLLTTPYESTRDQRQALRTLTSQLIGRYVHSAKLVDDGETGVQINPEDELEVKILKQITRDYVIANPSLAAQQHGYSVVIEFLFRTIKEATNPAEPAIPSFLPHRLHYLWEQSEDNAMRFAADCVASLTEREALALYSRLSGSSSGSVLDPILR